MNEPLCRALLQARLSEDDIAARLDIDPKTVRRWLEGRVPYLRYRWALAAILGRSESDLWPQLRAAEPRPGELQAIYPRLDSVPGEQWQNLLASAQRQIAVLADTGTFLTRHAGTMSALAARARAGVRMRICLADPAARDTGAGAGQASERIPADHAQDPAAAWTPLRDLGPAEIRLHCSVLYHTICRADDQLLVSQRAYGIPDGRSPVLHLRQTDDGQMAAAYLESFDRIWAAALPLRPR